MTPSRKPDPPRLASALLLVFVPLLEQEFVRGDLEEVFRRDCSLLGVGAARRRYWRQVLTLGVYRLHSGITGRDRKETAMELLIQDIRYGLRTLTQNLRFTVTGVVTLALGIGLNTAVFTVFDTFFMRSLPVERPHELVRIFARDTESGQFFDSFSYAYLSDLQEQAGSLAGVSSKSLVRASLSVAGTSSLIFGEVVSGNYFDTLGVDPQVGRRFLPEEYRIGGPSAVIIGDRLWRENFGADPAMVGQHIGLNNQPFTIVGVAPAGFQGTKTLLGMDFWVPVESWRGPGSWTERRTNRWLQLIARLQPGVSMDEAEVELEGIAARVARQHPEDEGRTLQLQTARGLALDADPEIASTARLAGSFALAAVALVLLIACANIASLLLARASARRREIGIRLAVGASRWRVVRQVLTESLLLAFIGGAAGLAVAYWAARSLPALFPVIPYRVVLDVSPNLSVLLFAFGVSALTGVVFGLAPALRSVRSELAASLRSTRESGGGRRRLRLGQLLVASQLAVAVVLLVTTGFFMRSLHHLAGVDTGFDDEKLAFLTVDFSLADIEPDAGAALYDALQRRLAAVAGITSVGFVTNLPLDDESNRGRLWAEGNPAQLERGVGAEFSAVSSSALQTLGVELMAGRYFEPSDNSDAPQVAIVDRALQQRLWPDSEAVGRRFSFRGPTGPFIEVVGVVETIRQHSLVGAPTPAVYRPLTQSYAPSASAVIKTSIDPAVILRPARETVRAVNPDVPVFNIRTLDQLMTFPLFPYRLGAILSTVFGLLALVLTASGLYGLISYTVARRTSEIGIRMALGAAAADVRSMVIRQGFVLLLAGGGIGAVAAFFIPGLLSAALLGTTSHDPLIVALVVAVIAVVSLAACYLPARRASSIDPIRALRTD